MFSYLLQLNLWETWSLTPFIANSNFLTFAWLHIIYILYSSLKQHFYPSNREKFSSDPPIWEPNRLAEFSRDTVLERDCVEKGWRLQYELGSSGAAHSTAVMTLKESLRSWFKKLYKHMLNFTGTEACACRSMCLSTVLKKIWFPVSGLLISPFSSSPSVKKN